MGVISWRSGMVALLAALLAACGGDEPSGTAPTPAAQPSAPVSATATAPPSTATPSVAPSPSPTAAPTVAPTTAPTPSATPTPPTPTPTASAVPVEYLPLTVGEPRELPEGLALFFGRYSCWQCGGAYVDFPRVVFDAEARAFRVDRPLAFFDEVGLPESFAVSRSGREMAVAVCGGGVCSWPPFGISEPDVAMHVWFSRDGGGSWEEAGMALPASFILAVTAADVLVWELNEWQDRGEWNHLDDGEWADFLAPLAPLGVTPSTSWLYRLRWLGSGEEFTSEKDDNVWSWSYLGWQDGAPDLAQPPTLGGLRWHGVDVHPDGAVAWEGWDGETSLLAIADTRGALRGVYGLPSSGQAMSFVAENLLVRGVDRPPVDEAGDEPPATEVELLDLATLRAHPVAGLSLPMDQGPASLGGVPYHFLFARPAAE